MSPGCKSASRAVLDDLEIAVEQLEGFFLLLVEVIGVLLARQLDDQLLGIGAVDAGDDHRAIFAEAAQSVVMRNSIDASSLIAIFALFSMPRTCSMIW